MTFRKYVDASVQIRPGPTNFNPQEDQVIR
jgi:hypothetical protein